VEHLIGDRVLAVEAPNATESSAEEKVVPTGIAAGERYLARIVPISVHLT